MLDCQAARVDPALPSLPLFHPCATRAGEYEPGAHLRAPRSPNTAGEVAPGHCPRGRHQALDARGEKEPRTQCGPLGARLMARGASLVT